MGDADGIKYDEVLAQLESDYDVPAEIVDRLRSSSLRAELGRVTQERDTYKAAAEGYEKAPKREGFFEAAGVDLAAVKEDPARLYLFENFEWEGDEPTAEAIQEYAAKFKFPMKEEAEAPPTGATSIADHAVAQTGSHPKPKSIDDEIAEAAASGNVAASIALKAAKLRPPGAQAVQ